MSESILFQKFVNFANHIPFFFINFSGTWFNMRNVNALMRITLLTIALGLVSCAGKNTATQETATRGDIKITVDESFQPLLDTEVYTFTQLYTNAKVKADYKPEYDVVNDFMDDSIKVIVTSKKLTEDQIQYLRDTLIVARTTTFAYDALALVINKSNNDTLLKYDEVKDIFLGKKTSWKDLDPKSKLGDISVIFDNTKSGNIRYFREQFNSINDLPGYFFAVNSNAEVIDYVSKNREALGIVSVNWISDKDDSTSRRFIDKVKTVAVSRAFVDDGYYYKPDQGSIYVKTYPFIREIYFISRETFVGLGSGFIQWATGEQGQRIVLKSGLVPATMPIRLVQINQ
jgi:phosphate transport system substrate-binding protein